MQCTTHRPSVNAKGEKAEPANRPEYVSSEDRTRICLLLHNEDGGKKESQEGCNRDEDDAEAIRVRQDQYAHNQSFEGKKKATNGYGYWEGLSSQ